MNYLHLRELCSTRLQSEVDVTNEVPPDGRDDGLPLRWGVEAGKILVATQAFTGRLVPRDGAVFHQHGVAPSAHSKMSRPAGFVRVRAASLVLPSFAVLQHVAREVHLDLRPERQRAVPLPARCLLGHVRVGVEGELQPESGQLHHVVANKVEVQNVRVQHGGGGNRAAAAENLFRGAVGLLSVASVHGETVVPAVPPGVSFNVHLEEAEHHAVVCRHVHRRPLVHHTGVRCLAVPSGCLHIAWGQGKTEKIELARTETIYVYVRLIRDGRKGEWGMEVGEEGDYIPIATLSPPE